MEHMDRIELETECEQLERQVEELTKQLNESKSAEKRANDEREKYFQLYNQTQQSFLTFEQQQLDQIRRILTIFTSDQPDTLSDQSFQTANDQGKAEIDWENIVTQITKLIRRCAEQSDENARLQDQISFLRSEYQQFNETNKLIEMDPSKRLRNDTSLADDEGDILLSNLMKKAEKNDVHFGELKRQYENSFIEQVNEMKKLIKEREFLHIYIQRLERENCQLSSRTNVDQTIQLLTHSSQTPSSIEVKSWQLIEQLREEIIEQMKLQDKLRNDIEQFQLNYRTDIRERKQIEEFLRRDLNAARDQILVFETIRSEYVHVLKMKNSLQRELKQRTNEFLAMKEVTNSLIDHVKEQTEKISLEKESLEEENVALRDQMQKLKVDFENSESVQYDFVKLSQALQIQLEEFRNSPNELRWQHEDDYSECQQCHSPFSMTRRKQHCHHCGKVLCKECVNKTICSGPNKRPSRVCNVCYTLLNKTSQPYFLAGVHNV